MIAIAVGAKGAVPLTVAPAALLLNCITPRGGSYCGGDVDLVSRGGRGGQADQPPHRDDEGEPSGGYSTTLGNPSSPFSHIEFELLQHEGQHVLLGVHGCRGDSPTPGTRRPYR